MGCSLHAASQFSRQLRPQTILHHVSHRGLRGADVGLKCRMLQVAARRLNRLIQQCNVQGVAQTLGSMVVAEAPIKPEGMTSVHSGVAIDTNVSAANGKIANSKQVHCIGACETPDQEAMQRAEITAYSSTLVCIWHEISQ